MHFAFVNHRLIALQDLFVADVAVGAEGGFSG